MDRWKELAHAESNSHRRADYAGLALVFAELTDCQSAWRDALEGWNVEVSMQVLEWQEKAAKRARTDTKIDAVLRVLRKRVPEEVPADVEETIRATSDFDQLDRWLDAAASASSLAEFRRLAGLEAKRNGRRKKSKTDRAKPGAV